VPVAHLAGEEQQWSSGKLFSREWEDERRQGEIMHEPMRSLDEIVFEEEKQPEPEVVEVEPEKRLIFAKPSDPTVRDLYDRYKEKDLILQSDFQRHFVWDNTKSSRLIESVVLDVPLPVIYLAEEVDGRESVIDGQQRLTSFFKFLDGTLMLTGLQARKDLNRKRSADLDKALRNKIRQAVVPTITIQKESDKNLKFEIFQRLNTGSVALNDQELRNCVYRGPYNKLLQEMASDQDFMSLIGVQEPEKRMRDVELVLRFTAFYHATYLKYRPPMRQFLNENMEQFRDILERDAEETRRVFKNSVQIIRSLLGKNAFKRFHPGTQNDPHGRWEPKQFNASLYDILMYGFTAYDKNQVYPCLDSIREALIWLMTEDQELIDAIELSTSSVKMVRTRFDKWRQTLQQVVGSLRREPRCFTRKIKEELFKQDPTCTLCGQRILDVDDAAVDHIEQYWLGGKTVPENARLTHHFCNRSRSRFESSLKITPDVVFQKERKKPQPLKQNPQVLDLIKVGFITPPLEIEREYRGIRLQATINPNGEIIFNGGSYPSLSTAADMARRSVRGAPCNRFPFKGSELPRMPANWKLSPSDFAFLWEECTRCFYLKVARQFDRLRSPMPRIFTAIDLMMKRYFAGKSTAALAPELPMDVVEFGDRWVESNPIVLPHHTSTCCIRGKFDTVVRFEDGSYGVVDCKTSQSKGEHVPLYSRQLHAYAYALEHAAPGKLRLSPVSRLGLLCVEPVDMLAVGERAYAYKAEVVWVDCPRDDAGFLTFLADVLDVLDRPTPPDGSPTCPFCRYRDAARQTPW
jgi:hypothetical protein